MDKLFHLYGSWKEEGFVPLSTSSAYRDQLVDATGLGERPGVFHIPAGDLMKCTADCCHGLIWQQGGSVARETGHQIPHGILSFKTIQANFNIYFRWNVLFNDYTNLHAKKVMLISWRDWPMSSLFLASSAMFRKAVATEQTTLSLSILSNSTRMGKPFSLRTAARM